MLGRTESLLYRRGNFNGTFDDLICQALLEERDAEIALSPGFRWGATCCPARRSPSRTSTTRPPSPIPTPTAARFTGAFLKEVLEDVADNLFNPDPYYQQGGDMVRVGGLATHRHPQADRPADLGHDPAGRTASRSTRTELRRRRLGLGQRGHRGAAGLRPGQPLHREEAERRGSRRTASIRVVS